jgi:hypothetical protein
MRKVANMMSNNCSLATHKKEKEGRGIRMDEFSQNLTHFIRMMCF